MTCNMRNCNLPRPDAGLLGGGAAAAAAAAAPPGSWTCVCGALLVSGSTCIPPGTGEAGEAGDAGEQGGRETGGQPG